MRTPHQQLLSWARTHHRPLSQCGACRLGLPPPPPFSFPHRGIALAIVQCTVKGTGEEYLLQFAGFYPGGGGDRA